MSGALPATEATALFPHACTLSWAIVVSRSPDLDQQSPPPGSGGAGAEATGVVIGGWRRLRPFEVCDLPKGPLQSSTEPIRFNTTYPAQACGPMKETPHPASSLRRDFYKVQVNPSDSINPSGPGGEATHPSGSKASSLTTARPDQHHPARHALPLLV